MTNDYKIFDLNCFNIQPKLISRQKVFKQPLKNRFQFKSTLFRLATPNAKYALLPRIEVVRIYTASLPTLLSRITFPIAQKISMLILEMLTERLTRSTRSCNFFRSRAINIGSGVGRLPKGYKDNNSKFDALNLKTTGIDTLENIRTFADDFRSL